MNQLEFVNRDGETIRYEKTKNVRTHTYEDSEKLGYILEVIPYAAKGYFGKRQAILYEDRIEIAEFWRNYSDFPFVFVEHSNGNLYFICSEDYHGQVTIYNITTGERRSIHPIDTMDDPPKYSAWFMWIDMAYDSESEELNVYGGYWGAESDFGTRTFDFSRPEEVPYNREWWDGIRTTEGMVE